MNHLSSWRGRMAVGSDHRLREPAVERSCSQSAGSLEVFRGEIDDRESLLGTEKTIGGEELVTPPTHTPGVDGNANLGFHNDLQFPHPSVLCQIC